MSFWTLFPPVCLSCDKPVLGVSGVLVFEACSFSRWNERPARRVANISLSVQRWTSAPSRTTVAVSNAVSTLWEATSVPVTRATSWPPTSAAARVSCDPVHKVHAIHKDCGLYSSHTSTTLKSCALPKKKKKTVWKFHWRLVLVYTSKQRVWQCVACPACIPNDDRSSSEDL